MKQKIESFFRGRYGADALARGMLVAYLAISVLTVFIKNAPLCLLLNIIALCICALMFFRMLSKNTVKRSAENLKYLRFRGHLKQWFLLRRNKWKYRKTHVYRKCPHCDSNIRLPRRSGDHICDCPKCGKPFDVKIK